jgi:hypothetical protein
MVALASEDADEELSSLEMATTAITPRTRLDVATAMSMRPTSERARNDSLICVFKPD